jgi:HK97 gp10 family phage protein
MQNKKNFDKAKDKIQLAIKNALNEIGLFVVAESQLRTPVDTSTLRRSETFKVDDDKNTVFVGSNVEYDQYVEMGTSKQKAQPHWTPAVMDNVEDINNIAKKHLEKVGEE